MQTIVVNRFDGGMTYDPRTLAGNVCQLCRHFDVGIHKLTPYRTAEVGDASAATNLIKNFAYDGTTVYGLGDTGAGAVKIFKRTAFANDTWSSLSAGGTPGVSSTFSTRDAPLFVFYKKTGKLYGVGHESRYVWSVTPESSAAQQAADLTAYSTVSNGIVHSKDDILYFGYDNKIAKNNNDSWTVAALTLPSDMIITSVCERGDFLAIACRPATGGATHSRVFLWKRDSTTVLLSESIDWGEGNLMLIEEIGGVLVGVSFEGTTGSFNHKGRVVFRYYDGTRPIIFEQFIVAGQATTTEGQTSVTNQATLYKTRSHNRVLFPATININDISYPGVWSIGRGPNDTSLSVLLEHDYLNQSSFGTLFGAIKLGDYLFASYATSSNAIHYTDKTDDTAVFTTPSIYISTINPRMNEIDTLRHKELKGFGVYCEPLTSGQTISVEYRVDGGTWQTIIDSKTATSPNADLTGYEVATPSGGETFQSGREYEFKLTSTGGAVITAFAYKYTTNPRDI